MKDGFSPAIPPRVAVIVPAYGVATLLPEALESLCAQTMPDWECVVVDDGAPDDVARAVDPFLADSRIRFLATSNGGVATARNRAVAATTAPHIALLDGDDLLRPDFLAHMLPALEGDREARLVTCNARIFGALPQPRLCVQSRQGAGDGITGTLGEVLDRSFNVYIGSIFRRADFDAVGGFDESMTHAEDLDFWVRLLMLGGHARYVDEVLGEYRVRRSSASASGAAMIQGNLRVYEKARAALGGRPEADIARDMIARNHAQLAFEVAVNRIADGDLSALHDLRAGSHQASGVIWMLAIALWRIAPSLAPAMLRWRRKANSRGAAGGHVAPLSKTSPALVHDPEKLAA